jgi:thioredoxin-dependent peroxiredoxin
MSKAHTTGGKPKAIIKETAHEMEGRKAPPFELPDGSGKTISLKELLGRGNLVLYFYPKDMTPGCTVEACDFRDSAAPLKAAGAQVVGVSTDSPESHRKFIDKHTLNFPLLSDP